MKITTLSQKNEHIHPKVPKDTTTTKEVIRL